MDIVDFWSKQVNKWKEEQKCDMCFEFSAPLFEDASNIFQTREACCTYVLLTGWKERSTPTYDRISSLKLNQSTDVIFTIDIVQKGDLGTNNYNEIEGHPIEQSRYETIYKPIRECINLNKIELDFCLFLGFKPQESKWELEMSRAYLDNNYFGWKITATFRIENSDEIIWN